MSMGKPLPHDAAPLHVTGQARYIDDLSFPANALHLAFGLSDHFAGPVGGAGGPGGGGGAVGGGFAGHAGLLAFDA